VRRHYTVHRCIHKCFNEGSKSQCETPRRTNRVKERKPRNNVIADFVPTSIGDSSNRTKKSGREFGADYKSDCQFEGGVISDNEHPIDCDRNYRGQYSKRGVSQCIWLDNAANGVLGLGVTIPTDVLRSSRIIRCMKGRTKRLIGPRPTNVSFRNRAARCSG